MARKETYEEFVEKFKPKRTTDDCYTPPAVYEAVRDWAIKEYGLQGRTLVRPFYPGGDFERYEYPENCVVLDNPPFSIMSKIIRFYNEKRIDYFLFCNERTAFNNDKTNTVICDENVVYENGATVNTGFATNMGEWFIRTAPELKKAIKKANRKQAKQLPKYIYPDNVFTIGKTKGVALVDFKLSREECEHVRVLDSQRPVKKGIYGAGYFISDKAAAELKAAELKAAELKAAELKAAELKAAELKAAELKAAWVWELSDREQEIVNNLNNKEANA